MRRGHQGSGGWRNENPRMFRQRPCSNPQFRTNGSFHQQKFNRFPLPGPRHHRVHFNSQIGNERFIEEGEWSQHRQESQFSFSRTIEREPYKKPFTNQINHGDSSRPSVTNYRRPSQNPEGYWINYMGDIDQRQILHNRIHSISPWTHDNNEGTLINSCKEKLDDYSKQQTDYAGHRPPASDHYGGNPIHSNENSKTFSRSVDDTVNIVRKRLLNREESHQTEEDNINDDSKHLHGNTKTTQKESLYHPNMMKRKTPKPRKLNCDRIKNKIVHQLFKMDKEKIHKLLDNPNSSTKFEYALNSLLTESQNSFNQHMRSVAEKSLCSSSKDFIQNDNNTIYEDTFMKQMQCILDPQDTVLLEDIKPVVMAELSHLLQLGELDDRYSYEKTSNYSYHSERVSHEEYHQDYHSYNYLNKQGCDNYFENVNSNCINDNYEVEVSHPLFERRVRKKSDNFSLETCTETSSRPLIDSEKVISWDTDRNDGYSSAPLFEANTEDEDEDTFAELDKQYHVAVDHDFIENEELSNPIKFSPSSQHELKNDTPKDHCNKNEDSILTRPVNNETLIEEEIVSQLKDLATVKLESSLIPLDIETKNRTNELIHSEPDETSLAPSTNSRKRSIDQRPYHRKEKRKKSLDKDETKKLCHEKAISCKDIPIYKDEISNNSGNSNHTTKICSEANQSKDRSIHLDNKKQSHNSEKNVKNKGAPNATTCDNRKRNNSTSSNHSTKADSKSSLKSIDMFTEVPKKVNIHQAFRNTAVNKTTKQVPQIEPKSLVLPNLKSPKKSCQDPKKNVSKETQTLNASPSVSSQFTQTGKNKLISKAIQVNIQPLENEKQNRAFDPLERMKQIDLEIQELLQEKFKLYSSIDSKDGTAHIPMQNLGMTVLNVSSFEDINEGNQNNDLEETIVNNLTTIPVEELEQIVFESKKIQSPSPSRSRRRVRQKVSSSLQDDGYPNVKKNKDNPLNFSLIEQIITDDRPLEDFISLDDLESNPTNRNKKEIKPKKPKKKATIKKKIKSPQASKSDDLKECYILLLREDLSKYITDKSLTNEDERDNENNIEVAEYNENPEETKSSNIQYTEELDIQADLYDNIEETVISTDIQFDMLDVSEDIIIGEIIEEKVATEKVDQGAISEDIILDNSQSSMEDNATAEEIRVGECKLYDYLADENLQHDSVVANGNADAILAIECCGPNFLAAGLDGNVYYFSADGQLISILRGSNLAVTCLCVVKEKCGTTVYTGSLDSRIRNYDLETGLEKGPECNVLSPIQTMDRAWDTVFVGTRTGFVVQFECKNNLLIPVSTVKFSNQSILALRAMKEGPRKVLLVAARSENVTIKDAQTGLLLRTLNGPKMTVYTLLYEDGKVYCGTSSHQIQVFEYTSGSHVGTHDGGKGAVCLRAAGGLLFAGCYDGCIYVYREGESRPLAQLRGPSLMLLCLTIVGTKIIAGFKDRSLYIWKLPLSILKEMIL